MNDKQFTDNFFRTMYELGYRKAKIEKGYIFFYEKPVTLTTWAPSIPIKCTCFTDEPQCIDIAEYLGVVDWSKVAVDTPILVSANGRKWIKRYFAKLQDGEVYAWDDGVTSWSASHKHCTTAWPNAKIAEV